MLLATEGAYRAFDRTPFYRRTYPGGHVNRALTWARPDAKLGWVFNEDAFAFYQRPDRTWTATINPQGFRSPRDYREHGAKTGAVRIMMLGDSFLFGSFLDDPDTLSSLLQQTLGPAYEVDNFGVPGWGLDQMYLAYREYAGTVAPDVVIVVYIDEDILRVFEAFRTVEGMSKPSFALADGRLTLRTHDDSGPLERMAEVSLVANRLYKYGYRLFESSRIARALFVELARETRARGQTLIVVRYPTKAEIIRNRWRWFFDLADFFRREAIIYLDPSDAMIASGPARSQDFFFRDNMHPAGEGNRFLAGYIARHALASP